MAEIFKRTELEWGGAFAADKGLLSISGGIVPFLLQNLGMNYSQNITRLYEIGEQGQISHVYYVGGRSQGSLSLGRVIGPRTTLVEFYSNFSDVCNAANNSISVALQAQCDSPNSILADYTAKMCVLVGVGLSVGSQDLIVNESSQVMFSNLDYEETGL